MSDTTSGDEPADDGTAQRTPAAEPLDIVSFWWDDQQRFHLHGEFDEATGSIIESALTEARDGLFQNGQADVDWADALLEVAERSLDGVESAARRARYRTHIYREQDGTVTNATGCAMTDAVADYISCDSLRSDVYEVDGVPISVALCNRHHRTHHQGRLGITGNADDPTGVIFTNRQSQPIRAPSARPTPPGEQSATEEAGAPYRPALRERLESRWQHFNPPHGFRPKWDHDLWRTVNPRQHTN